MAKDQASIRSLVRIQFDYILIMKHAETKLCTFFLNCRCSFISSPANCHRLQSHGCPHFYYRGQCRSGLGRPRIPDHSSPAASGSHGAVCGTSSSAAGAVPAEATRIRREFLWIHDTFGDVFPAAGGRGERRRVVDGGGRRRSGTVRIGIGRAEPEEEASEAGAC